MLHLFARDRRLYCFSPPVMLATFLIESGLALYCWWKYKASTFSRLIIATLCCLALFQLMEFQICTSQPLLVYAQVGLAAISLLPALGWHLVNILLGRQRFVAVGYTMGGLLAGNYLLGSQAVGKAVCSGNYVIFSINHNIGSAFGGYYYIFLILAVAELGRHAYAPNVKPPRKRLLQWMMLGYLTFMLPMATVYLFSAAVARSATPSIMCGFALILALILALQVLPRYYKVMRPRLKSAVIHHLTVPFFS